ncbi:MAG: hypothetical protein HS113_01375 [Verrucomicrobiales bacterium]|nr:hypothetical protein [Verrucomicrobiales bacterium]
MADELSPQQAQQVKDLVEQAKTQLEAKAEELKDKPGSTEEKRQLARKIGVATGTLAGFKLGVLPSPEEAVGLLEDLESNINIFIRTLKKAIEAIKVLIQGIIDILKTLVDGIRSLFPKQETQTAYLGDNPLGSQAVSTFVMINDPTPSDGIIVIPAAFANREEPLKGRFRPSMAAFAVRSSAGDRSQCFQVQSLVARSLPTQLGDLKLPAFDQMLDPRRPSVGTLDLETGRVTGELNTTLFDGVLYRPQSPIFVRSKFSGTYSPDTGMLALSTQAIDIASNAPFLQLAGKPC